MKIVTEEVSYRKKMTWFALFLAVGGSINFLGQIIPAILGFDAAAASVYVLYSFIAISLFPTPIIIVAFLKPVWKEAMNIVTCGQLPRSSETPEKTSDPE